LWKKLWWGCGKSEEKGRQKWKTAMEAKRAQSEMRILDFYARRAIVGVRGGKRAAPEEAQWRR
jgi:hypothetical protein